MLRRFAQFFSWCLLCLFSVATFAVTAKVQPQNENANRKLERGNFFVESFDMAAIGADARNYAIVSDDKGRIYLANNSGIFVYDGSQWRLIKVTTELATRSLAIYQNRLYIGARWKFGYIELNSVSGLAKGGFHSLEDLLPQQNINVGVIKGTVVRPEGVYFRSNNAIYFYDHENTLQVIKPDDSIFHRMFVVHDKLIIQKRRQGLYELKNGQLNVFVQGEFFSDKTVYALLDYQQAYLIFSADKGIFVYDGLNIKPFVTDAVVSQILQHNTIYLAQWLKNGLLALAITGQQQGLMLIDSEGNLVRLVSNDDGLSDTVINVMLEDVQGGLWLGMVNGLDRVEVGSSLTYFDIRHGLQGYMYSLARFNGVLYAATSRGVFKLVTGVNKSAKFEQIEQISEICYALQPSVQGLVVACDANLYQIVDQDVRHIQRSIHNIYSLIDATIDANKPQMLVGHSNKLGLLTYTDSWHYRHLIDIDSVTMARGGTLEFWLRHQVQGVVRLLFDQNFDKPPRIEHFDSRHGLPKGRIYPSAIDGEVYFNSVEGLYQFEAAKNVNQSKFIRTDKFGDFTGRDVYIAQNQTGRIYLTESVEDLSTATGVGSRLALLDSDENEGYQANFADFSRLSTYPILSVYAQKDGVVWVMSDGRLLRYEPGTQLQQTTSAFITKLATLNSHQQLLESIDEPLVLSHKNNSLRFDFAFAAFDEHHENRFQYRLTGYDEDWSDWRGQSHKEYTQIYEGSYSFELRAKDVYGRIASAKPLELKILPPWYRTVWAYLFYFIIIVVLVLLSLRVRTRTLIERAQNLEAVIDERTKTIREGAVVIEQQKEAIESLLAQKNDLFANISHEFRTPLTLILGPTNSLLKGKLTKPQQNHLHLIRQSSFRLLRMVNQILTLAKLSAIPHQEKVNLSVKAHVDFMIASFAPLAKEKQIELKVNEFEEVTLYMVTDALEKILVNLLSNAIKYTPEGGTVSLTIVKQNNDNVAIKVADTGYGIPQEQVSRVFERFKRINHPEHVKVQGTGLGLSMVKQLVEAHRGKISLISEQGKGSEFTVELPIAFVDVELDSQSVIAQARVDVDIELQAFDFKTESSHQATGAISNSSTELKALALESSSDEKVSLLVIEDTRQMREFLVSMFEQEYVVYSAADGEQGIELAKQHLPDIIISDVMMPGKNGYEVCNALKSDELSSHIPIILLTAKSDLESRMQGWREQADEYLAKPFDEDELRLRVTSLLAIRKTLKNRFGRMLHDQPEQLSQVTNELNAKDQDFLNRFAKVIEKHYSESDFNLPQAASEMYASERLLQKKLKALMDHTFTEYLRTYRLNKAALLLKEGKKASDVADECGFSSQAYFSRCFKAEFGLTATQYQQQN